MNTAVNKYLTRYAHADADASAAVTRNYNHAIVIPIYDEPAGCVDRVFNRLGGIPEDVLVIAVLNAPDNAPDPQLANTRALLTDLGGKPNMMVLDYCTSRLLPKREGVGLARKIGTDTALTLYQQGRLRNPWLFQTDADAQLPADYFQSFSGAGARVFAHQHQAPDGDCQLARAAQLYDLHMTYYVDGLARAGSPYAHPTLGSTLTIHADSYAQVRGYPRRNAAEDFYLLNKIAKVADVRHHPDIEITLDARLSPRVPFGTGPALASIVEQLKADPTGATYLSYHPRSFELLGTALDYLQQLASTDQYMTCADERVETILNRLNIQRVRDVLHHKYQKASQRSRVLTHWFDAFRTLRFIHEARHFFKDQPLLESLA